MNERVKILLPGENTSTVLMAAFIGLLAGLVNILFRSVEELVHSQIFERGYELLHIGEGGLHLLLLPLIPVCGMLLLIPLSLLFPGQINGYGFTKFLRKVNLEGGKVQFRTIILKILSASLTIGTMLSSPVTR